MPEASEQEFYDSLVGDYDEMTAFDRRLGLASEFVRALCARNNVKRAADVACGTGLYTIAMAEAGIDVVGMDISTGMIEAAREKVLRRGLTDRVQFFVQAMQERPGDDIHDLDAVICMANSVPHLLDPDDLQATLRNFCGILRAGGVAVIHLLNYSRVLKNRERIVSIDRHGSKDFVRFYDFLEDGTVRFNILRVEWGSESEESSEARSHELQSVRLRPYRYDELQRAMEEAGFTNIECFGSPKFAPFDPHSSTTVMITGRKPLA